MERIECNSLSIIPYFSLFSDEEGVIINSSNENSGLHTVTLLSQGAYKKTMVDKILEAKNSPPVASFTKAEDFNAWLDNLHD